MLANLREVLNLGRQRGIAVGSFNTPDLECLLAVIRAAEALDVPVIIMHAQIHESIAHLDDIGPVMLLAARRAKVKVCVHLDHGEDYEYCKRAVDLGFTSVMIDCSAKPFAENIATTARVVRYAHLHGASVEAELGALPNREGGGESGGNPKSLYTDPALVPEFLRKTNIDALAIAFGTAHGIYKSTPKLDLGVIERVRAITDIPLVMHGGSGISDDVYREVIRRGIGKINYYTYLSYAGYKAAKERADREGEGFFHNLVLTAQKAMYENALKTLKVFSGMQP